MSSYRGKLNLPPGIDRAGEAAARMFISEHLDYKILQTNFRTREGEIDIIAKLGATLVFIEVKTRTNKEFGLGIEQITKRKAIRLQAAAQRYLEQTESTNVDWRIDLLSIEMTKSGHVQHIAHVQNAIEL